MNKLSIKLCVRHWDWHHKSHWHWDIAIDITKVTFQRTFASPLTISVFGNVSPLRKIHSPANCFGHYWISQSNNKFNHIFTDMSCTSNYVACWREMHYVILKFSPGRWKKAEEILLLLHWRRDLKHRDQNIMRLDSLDLGFVIWTSK